MDDGCLDAFWNRGFERRQLRKDAIGCCDDVRARLPEDDEQNRALPVQETSGTHILHRVDDIGHIGEVHG